MINGKRILSVILTLVIIIGLFGATINATGVSGSQYSYIIASANAKIVHVDDGRKDVLTATSMAVTDEEAFKVVNNSDGTISLFSKDKNSYVAYSDGRHTELVIRNFSGTNDWRKFKLEQQTDGTVAFKAVKTNKYVTVDLKNGVELYASSITVGVNEKFTIVTPEPPASPTGLTVSSFTADSVSLTWATAAGATSYNVYRSKSLNGIYTRVNMNAITTTSYKNSNLASITTYFYKVLAVNINGKSALSEAVSATTTFKEGYSYIVASTNSKIVHAGTGRDNELTVTSTTISDAESFQVIYNSDNSISLLSKATNSYVTPHDNGSTKLVTGKFFVPNDWRKIYTGTSIRWDCSN